MRKFSTPLLIVTLMFPAAIYSQERMPEIEILSKEDAKAMFNLTRAQWTANVRRAVVVGAAQAIGNQDTGITMITSTPLGYLMVKPDYNNNFQTPEFIQATAAFLPSISAVLTDEMMKHAIEAAKKQMQPEYEVLGSVERLEDGLGIFFTILERKQ